jgi:DNA-binding CsgD family transcriptional regulator
MNDDQTHPLSAAVATRGGGRSPTHRDGASASVPVWWSAGQMVVDRHPVPAMVIDSTDRIRAVNRLLAESPTLPASAVIGQPWIEAWPFDAEAAKTASDALARARHNEIAHATLSITTPQGDTVITFFELSALGTAPEGVVIATVLSTRIVPKTPSVPAATGIHYEVEIDTWRLLRVWSPDGALARTEGRCYEVLRGRDEPCPGCPVAAMSEASGVAACAVAPDPSKRFKLNVVNARPAGPGVATVSTWGVDDELMSLLISAKVDTLAKRAGLSERERAVLDMMLLGRTHAEIAKVLDISPRTVKYHQCRMQSKLGADSRLDIIRLVL